jgi:hypothetical protein
MAYGLGGPWATYMTFTAKEEAAATAPGGGGFSGVSAHSGTSAVTPVIGPPWWPPMRSAPQTLRPVHVVY